jgi:hypothetical protein
MTPKRRVTVLIYAPLYQVFAEVGHKGIEHIELVLGRSGSALRFVEGDLANTQGYVDLLIGCWRWMSLQFPCLERFRKSALTGVALFQRQDGAPIVSILHRDVQPRAVPKQFDVTLLLSLDRGQPDQKEAGGNFH